MNALELINCAIKDFSLQPEFKNVLGVNYWDEDSGREARLWMTDIAKGGYLQPYVNAMGMLSVSLVC